MESFGPQTAPPNSLLKPLPRNRRQTVRHRVHTPAYASLTGSDDMVLDLSEVLDISERGAAIQTSSMWNANRVLNLSLDLSETKTSLRTTGYVVWADRTGRIGVCFPDLSEGSRRKLREWLFLNAMVGAANYVARHGDVEFKPDTLPKPQRSLSSGVDLRAADYTTTLTALAAVKREVEAYGPNLDVALHLIAERCCTFTRANGSAIALAENGEMVCRACAGDAPPVGVTLELGSGFSGYCIRTGYLQRCDDTETDHRVDRESCRLLGIRSIIAVPIRQGNFVIGLLEVFSSTAHAFNERDCTILQRLAEVVLTAVDRGRHITVSRGAHPAKANGRSNAPISLFGSSGSSPSPSPPQHRPGDGGFRFPQRHLVFLLIAAFSIAMVLAYLLSPWVVGKLHPTPEISTDSIQELPQSPAEPQVVTPVPELGLNEIRKRAELGDPYEQVALATRYAIGEDVPQDYSMAVRWFLKAAEQGHVGAQDTLGAYYWLGHGVRKDVTKAYFWSVLARASGKEASKVRVAFMSSQLTRPQAMAIQREANEFLKQHPPLMNSESSY